MRNAIEVILVLVGIAIGFVLGRITLPAPPAPGEVASSSPLPAWTAAPEMTREDFPTPDLVVPSPIATAPLPPVRHLVVKPSPVAMAPPMVSVTGAEIRFDPAGSLPVLLRIKQDVAAARPSLRFEFDGGVPRHRVFRVRNPNRVIVDFESVELPADSGPRAGAAPMREVRARTLRNADGSPMTRVEILFDEEAGALPDVARTEDTDVLVLRW